MPIAINGTGTITGVSATGIDAVQNLPATGSFTTLGVTGNLSFNSGYGSSAVAYGCRVWVNFNGTGTVAIRGSGNVSSITDNNTGDYTVNFTTAMPDANYSVNCTPKRIIGNGNNGVTASVQFQTLPSTTSARVACVQFGSSLEDTDMMSVVCFR